MVTEIVSPTSLEEHQQALVSILKEFDRICDLLDIPYVLFAGTLLGAVRHKGIIPWDDDIDVLMLRSDYERFLDEAEAVIDKEKFFLQKEFSEHWPMFFSKLRLNGTTCLEKYHPNDTLCHHGVYIDIFPCDNASDNSFLRKIQFYASKVVIAKSLKRRGYVTNSTLKKAFMFCCSILPMSPFFKLARLGKPDSKTVHTFFGAASGYEKNFYQRSLFTNKIKIEFCGSDYPVPSDYDCLLKIIYGDYMTLPPVEERRVKEHYVLVDLHNSYEYYKDYHLSLEFDVLTRSIR